MLTIKTFQCNMLGENCYVVSDENREAVIIDCGAFYEDERTAIKEYIGRERLRVVHLLCTHGHLDHCFGNNFILSEFGLHPEVSQEDDFLIADLSLQARSMFGLRYQEPTPAVGHHLTEGELVDFGSHRLQVIGTPGHTPGSVVFYCKEEKVAFSGDTLFRMSIGRTDFERGSWADMMESLKKMAATLPGDTKVYCGHGPTTTIEEEINYNPYFRA